MTKDESPSKDQGLSLALLNNAILTRQNLAKGDAL